MFIPCIFSLSIVLVTCQNILVIVIFKKLRKKILGKGYLTEFRTLNRLVGIYRMFDHQHMCIH